MLAGRTERRDVPHEDGQWLEFRTLSGRELDEAEQAQMRRGMEMMTGINLSAMGDRATDLIREAAGEVGQKMEDSYDKDLLIKYGVAAWSADDPCTDENKERLDAATRAWAVSVIVEMNTRPLASDNGSGPHS